MSDVRTLWKASVRIDTGPTAVSMRRGAEIVHVGITGNTESYDGEAVAVELWYLCDPKAETETRQFAVVPTGGFWSAEEWRYVGTYASHASVLVWHVVEQIQ